VELAIAHNGSKMLRDLVPRDVELAIRRNAADLWGFQWTKGRLCILSLDDYSLCAWLKCGRNLKEVVDKFARDNLKLTLILLGNCHRAFGIMFDRDEFLGKKIYRSNGGLMLDMCHTIKTPLRYLYVDRQDLPVVTSTINYLNPPFGYRLGPNA
jgi:hypothetical protein